MMDDSDLLMLFRDGESDRVERKASLADRSKIREAMCAFANDLPGHGEPGVVFVGVNDDGSCSNLEITDELLRTVSQWRDDGNILPLPSLTVEKRTLDGCTVAVITVEPADAPPVAYRGRTYVRIGPRRGIATPDDERRLAERRRTRDLPFDGRRCRGSSLEDLDLDFFAREYLRSAVAEEVLTANQRSVEDQLRALRFLAPDDTPTHVALLVLGRDPRAFLPGAYVQFLRIDGDALADSVVDQKEIDGPVLQLLRRLDDVIEANNSTATDFTSARVETRHPVYPVAALHQLTRNAVLHRTYEGTNAPVRIYWFRNRIEIHSPGGLFGCVTAESFGAPGVTDYRNPILAEALKNLGLVQRFGVGIATARRALERNGNPELVLVAQASSVMALVEAAR